MGYLTSSREGKRFLGHREPRTVHDLKYEDKSQCGCRVGYFIRAGHAVGFIIDNLNHAHKERYSDCAKCIGRALNG